MPAAGREEERRRGRAAGAAMTRVPFSVNNLRIVYTDRPLGHALSAKSSRGAVMAKGGNGAKAAANSGRTAVAYFRTSSAANVGADKDTVQRQRDAVTAYAAAHGLTIVREFYDAAVSGADA